MHWQHDAFREYLRPGLLMENLLMPRLNSRLQSTHRELLTQGYPLGTNDAILTSIIKVLSGFHLNKRICNIYKR